MKLFNGIKRISFKTDIIIIKYIYVYIKIYI